jgi:hypothetical protein
LIRIEEEYRRIVGPHFKNLEVVHKIEKAKIEIQRELFSMKWTLDYDRDKKEERRLRLLPTPPPWRNTRRAEYRRWFRARGPSRLRVDRAVFAVDELASDNENNENERAEDGNGNADDEGDNDGKGNKGGEDNHDGNNNEDNERCENEHVKDDERVKDKPDGKDESNENVKSDENIKPVRRSKEELELYIQAIQDELREREMGRVNGSTPPPAPSS